MSYYPLHSLNGSEPLQSPTGSSSINYTHITYRDGVGPGYYQPQNQSHNIHSSYDRPQYGGGSPSTIEEVLLSAESHSRSDADLGLPENARTDVDILEDDLASREDYRMAVILNAIRIAIPHKCHLWRRRLCPKLRELWVKMIEGSDPTDDIWLWVDGDEQWLRENFCETLAKCSFTGVDHKGDWLDAHLALRRRINRPRTNAGRHAQRIRNATPEQRIAAICWLTCNSNRTKDLAIQLGHTPWGMFGLHEIVECRRRELHTISLVWGAFPDNDDAWDEAVKKLKEDGCTCPKKTWITSHFESWFNMLTWLDGQPPTLEVIGMDSCTRCQSLANSHYDEHRHKFEGTYPKVSLWDTLCLHALRSYDPSTLSFAPYLSRLAGLDARQKVEPQLWSALKKSHEENIEYIPHINEHYPSPLRQHAASLFCTAGFQIYEEHPPQGVSIDIPDGILDGAPLTVMLGGIAWFATCLRSYGKDSDDEHNEEWHRIFFRIFKDHLETFTDYPLPKLSAQGSAFCKELHFDFLEEFCDIEPTRILRIFAAVAILLRNKNVLLQCCRRCQILYTRFSATLSTNVNESSAMNTDTSDTSLDHITTDTKENLHIDEDLLGMGAFTNIMIDKSLTKEQLQSQLATKFTSLTRHMESVGLDLSVFIPPNDSSRVSSILRPLGSGAGQVAKLSKSDKIEQIKIKLLEMLRSFNVFISHGRLPWSTLESDLEKRGIVLINWPAEVPRKHSNRGIYDLSAEHTDTLYHAIMHPDKEKCLRLRYLLPSAVTHATDATHVNVASSLKRPRQGE